MRTMIMAIVMALLIVSSVFAMDVSDEFTREFDTNPLNAVSSCTVQYKKKMYLSTSPVDYPTIAYEYLLTDGDFKKFFDEGRRQTTEDYDAVFVQCPLRYKYIEKYRKQLNKDVDRYEFLYTVQRPKGGRI